MACPQCGQEEFRVRAEGIAILMCLDRSGSMQEPLAITGARTSRLEVARRAFRDFVAGGGGLPGRPNDRIGLIAFTGFEDERPPGPDEQPKAMGEVQQPKAVGVADQPLPKPSPIAESDPARQQAQRLIDRVRQRSLEKRQWDRKRQPGSWTQVEEKNWQGSNSGHNARPAPPCIPHWLSS